MFFLALSIVVPILVYALFPAFIQIATGKQFKRDGILLVACVLYFISWQLPSPLIHGHNTSFTTHLIGGGVFTGLLWLSVKKQMNWKMTWLIEAMSLFACVCMLGVTNELFELATVELHLTRLTGTDTWWDLFANTLGAFIFWIFYRIVLCVKRPSL
ncbi:MAG: hypothetical protein ABIO72_02125 [Patescibacteria group bacterium]